MKYKVLLINPIADDEAAFIRIGRCQTQAQPGIECWPPVDLALIGSALKGVRGVEDIQLYDAQENKDYQAMLQFLIIEAPDIVILNCTTPTFFSDIELAKQIKTQNKESFIIFFGLHATARSMEIMESLLVDCCVIGEPEDAIQSVVEHYINTGKDSFHQIHNILYLSNENRIIETKRSEDKSHVFLSQIPNRSLINNHYYKLQYNNKPFTIIQTSRGCPNKCIYCTASLYSPQYTSRTVSSVINEIEQCIEVYKIKNFMFLSDTFTADRKWVEEFCRAVLEKKIKFKWMSNSRIDKIDYSLARLMKAAGCWIISLGIESSDENLLRDAKKNITRNQINQAVKDLHSAKIKIIGYFMFGLPGENKESIQNTIHFSKSLPLDYAYFYHTTPFPGTVLYEMARKNRWLVTNDWRQYAHGKRALLEYEDLPIREVENALQTAYRKFYYRPGRVFKQLLTIRSVKVFFNNIRAAVNLLHK